MENLGSLIAMIKAFGTASDEQITAAVADWLDDHPEATTTVEDGAITTAKLSNGSVETAKIADASVTTAKLNGVIDNTLSVSGKAGDAKATGDSISNVKSIIGNINIATLFELGSANANSGGFTYSNNYERVRLKQGTSIHLKEGDVIGLTNYTNARFMYAWKRTSTGTYNSDGWFTANKTITQEGDYVIVIGNLSDTEQESPYALASLFFGYQAIAFDSINANITNVHNLSKIETGLHIGYIQSDGQIGSQDSTKKEYYTDKISCENGDVFTFVESHATHHGTATYYALYDETGGFISRTLLFDGQKTYWTATLTINNADAKYVAFFYLSYGDGTIEIYCDHCRDTMKWKQLLLKSQSKIGINSINHRGWFDAPENTLPAYRKSRENGFTIVEGDLNFTSDSVPVLLHDDTINRTARNEDGTSISGTVYINSITYAQALNYDFGIWKNPIYAGTKIPKFKEFVVLCKNLGIMPYIELKDGTQEQINVCTAIAKDCGMADKITWVSSSDTMLNRVKNGDAKARLGLINNYTIDSSFIAKATALKTTDNEVFIESGSWTDAEVTLCKEANIPLEIFVINDRSDLSSLNPYITGILSDRIVASQELYLMNIK